MCGVKKVFTPSYTCNLWLKDPIDEQRPKVAVATLDAKAYYTVTSLLKAMKIPFESVTPSREVEPDIQLILTTRGDEVRGGRILYIEELGEDVDLAKEKILSVLYGGPGKVFTVGIDPGERIGIAAYYHGREVHGEVVNSVDEAVLKVAKLTEGSYADRRVVRIGGGDPRIASEVADRLLGRVGGMAEVEIVDERGTSTSSGQPGGKGLRDLRSARIIAFREGRRYRGGGVR